MRDISLIHAEASLINARGPAAGQAVVVDGFGKKSGYWARESLPLRHRFWTAQKSFKNRLFSNRRIFTVEHRGPQNLPSSGRARQFNKAEGGDIWFALDETRPLACFAGIWTNWTSVRKVKEGETTNDLYAFLTTEPNAEVGAIHPKAMPVILTTPDEAEAWMTAPAEEALKLQRSLQDARSGSWPAG
jgi:putative SOS response-associated peptidase YedK